MTINLDFSVLGDANPYVIPGFDTLDAEIGGSVFQVLGGVLRSTFTATTTFNALGRFNGTPATSGIVSITVNTVFDYTAGSGPVVIGMFAANGDGIALKINFDSFTIQNYTAGIEQAGNLGGGSGGTFVAGDDLRIDIDLDNGTMQAYEKGVSFGTQATGLTFTGMAAGMLITPTGTIGSSNGITSIAITGESAAASNNPPAIDTPEADIIEPAGTAWTRDISDNSSDADLDTLTYSVSPALPTGITLNSTTGVITATTATVAQVPTNYTFTHSDGTDSVDDIVSIHITGILSVGGDNEMDNNETDVLITTTGLPASVTTFTSVKVDSVVMDNPRWNSGQPLFDAPSGMALGSALVVEIEFTE